jgi:hypothetical protein
MITMEKSASGTNIIPITMAPCIIEGTRIRIKRGNMMARISTGTTNFLI